MAKRIELDGKFYRKRRGKLVQIPDEWVGKCPDPQTIRKRPSKETRKSRNSVDRGWRPGGFFSQRYLAYKRGALDLDRQTK